MKRLSEEDGGGDGAPGGGENASISNVVSTTTADIATYPWPLGVPRGAGYDRPVYVKRFKLPKGTFSGFSAALLDPNTFDRIVYGMKRTKRKKARRRAKK